MSLMCRRALYAKDRQVNNSQRKVLSNYKRDILEYKLEQPNCAIEPVWFWAECYNGDPKETSISLTISAAF
jgi:hypothetical protein